MKVSRNLKSMLMMAVLGAAAAIGSGAAIAQVSVTANGPYYATPSWDQKITTGRFVVLANWNNEAVLDRETGLVWQKVPSTSQVDLFNASILCINSNTGGRKGWRVPSITEFMSLVDESQSSPALPSGHPFTILVSQGFLYWSITNTLSPNVRTAWLFHPFNGLMTNFPLDTSVGRPWCVRGGSGGVDTQ